MQKKKKRHSKFKNAGMLFELLTRQITSDILAGRSENFAKNLLMKYFNKDTDLGKELRLYNFLLNKKLKTPASAHCVLETVLHSRKKLNEKNLRDQKFNLIKEIKERYDIANFLKNKIPNYRFHASIYKIFENHISENVSFDIDEIVSAKNCILENLSTEKVVSEKEKTLDLYSSQPSEIRLVAYKFLIENFNEKYSSLIPTQKKLLKEYISSSSTSTQFKEYFKNEVAESVDFLEKNIKNINSKITQIKLVETISQLKNKRIQDVPSDSDLSMLMHVYELIEEIKKNI
jgi:hypothetical protein